MQTSFRFSPLYIHSTYMSLMLERGVHKPSPAESMAPFHQDPTQRIIALRVHYPPHYLVLRVGALLELLKGREGTEVEWDEWENHVAFPSLCSSGPASRGVQVSGSRLFHMYFSDFVPCMSVYDFSLHGRAKYSSKQTDIGLGVVNRLSSTGAQVPVPLEEFFDCGSSHESIIFSRVSTAVFCSP